jgi:TolB-like protein
LQNRWTQGAAGIAVLLVAALLAYFTFVPRHGHATHPERASTDSASAVRVGVLPFDVLSEAPATRHFADGMTDEIISMLSGNQMQTVSREDSVALRGATRNQTLDKLGAALLFDGTVEENGDELHVRVHLDSATTHGSVWSDEFTAKATESRTLQTEVAAECAGMIQLALFAKSSPAVTDDQTLAMTLKVVDGLRYGHQDQHGIETARLAEQLVAKVGSVAYWQSTGKWPDF